MKPLNVLVAATCFCLIGTILVDYGYMLDPPSTKASKIKGSLGDLLRDLGLESWLELAKGRILRKENIFRLLVASTTMPFVLFCALCTTNLLLLAGLLSLCHGVAFAQGGGAWMHLVASAVAYLAVEAFKFVGASKQLRDWRAEIKKAEEGEVRRGEAMILQRQHYYSLFCPNRFARGRETGREYLFFTPTWEVDTRAPRMPSKRPWRRGPAMWL